jgi:phenylpropionate dioxygenase-like ring-hydroxylating dioxygenase large terminal subunit
MIELRKQVTGIVEGVTRFPRYDAAVLGMAGYWYPVTWSASVRGRPLAHKLFGRDLLLMRSGTRVVAVEDRCPHRGVALSLGKQVFPGTVTCRYHGWTFDLTTGELRAALTDGPDSPICGKARVRTYAVEERAGLVWIYNGDDEPPPVERDIPAEFLDRDAVVVGRITTRAGDWRHAAENGFDDGHAKYLHRTAWRALFAKMPGYTRMHVTSSGDGWITRIPDEVCFEAEYPGLGRWPRQRFWKRRRGGARLSIRMPGVLRSSLAGHYDHFEWYVATEPGRHRYLQFLVQRATGLRALRFRLTYHAFSKWLFHVQFNNQDAAMVELMKTPPEQLYRPDISLIAWRHLCENAGAAQAQAQETAPLPDRR